MEAFGDQCKNLQICQGINGIEVQLKDDLFEVNSFLMIQSIGRNMIDFVFSAIGCSLAQRKFWWIFLSVKIHGRKRRMLCVIRWGNLFLISPKDVTSVHVSALERMNACLSCLTNLRS